MHTAILRRYGRRLLLAGGLLAPVASPATAQRFPPDSAVELMLRYMVEDGQAPAIALGLVDDSGAASVVAYGDPGPGARPLGPGSVFEIGTITMTFTATLLAEMVERGEVSLDDPVSKYLPAEVTVPSLSGYPITLRHLAMHTSGLPAEPPESYDDFTVEDLYRFLSRYELDWVPGRRREFSTVGYGLLGLALARAAGTSYPALLRERILAPLGMDRTGFALAGPLKEWMVRGHDGDDVVAFQVPTPALQGATGLRSSAADMVAYLKANADTPSTALGRAMAVARTVRTPYDPEGEGYGFSWRTYEVARQPLLVTHGGRTPGFSALISFDPVQGIGTVALANTRRFNDWTARDLLFPGPPPTRRAVRVDPAVLRRYVGTYGGRGNRYRASIDRGSYFIRLGRDGVLTYQPRGNVRTPLYAESDSSFYMVRGPYTVTFSGVGEAMEMRVRVDAREPTMEGRTWRAWKRSDDTPPPMVVADNAGLTAGWGPGTWTLIVALGVGVLAAVLRPFWARRRAA